jgi:hypothetical protein
MTNLAAFAHADAPLFLFHLLEYSGVPFDLDVEDINRRWADNDNIDDWSQLVIKHTGKEIELITSAPRSGVYQLEPNGSTTFIRAQTHRRTVQRKDRAFFLRIANQGDWFYEGADLGILVMPGRLMTKNFQLTSRAKEWISGIRAQYNADSVSKQKRSRVELEVTVGGFKLL